MFLRLAATVLTDQSAAVLPEGWRCTVFLPLLSSFFPYSSFRGNIRRRNGCISKRCGKNLNQNWKKQKQKHKKPKKTPQKSKAHSGAAATSGSNCIQTDTWCVGWGRLSGISRALGDDNTQHFASPCANPCAHDAFQPLPGINKAVAPAATSCAHGHVLYSLSMENSAYRGELCACRYFPSELVLLSRELFVVRLLGLQSPAPPCAQPELCTAPWPSTQPQIPLVSHERSPFPAGCPGSASFSPLNNSGPCGHLTYRN